MGKQQAENSDDSDQAEDKVNRRRRRKKEQLEEIRRNALIAKRNLRTRPVAPQKPQSNLMKNLHQLASRRKALEDATQCKNILTKNSNTDPQQIIPMPQLNGKGFFRGAVKGKLITRESSAQDKLRNAILNNDALQLMQSVGHSVPERPPIDVNPQLRKHIIKVFKDSSQNSFDANNCIQNNIKQISPIKGKNKSSKNPSAEQINKKAETSQKDQVPVMNLFGKEEKCKRRLFEDENIKAKNPITQVDHDKLTSRKSTPENVIFFSDNIPWKNVNNMSHKSFSVDKLNPAHPKFTECFIQINKMIDINFQNILWNSTDDPEKITRENLRSIYRNTFKEELRRQKLENTVSTNNTPLSNNSKIMLEPDSAIRRTLKKNSTFPIVNCVPKKNSHTSSHELHKSESFSSTELVQNNYSAKHRSSSNNENEINIPCSTKANVGSTNARMLTQIDLVHEDRKEILTRYMKDIKCNTGEFLETNYPEDEPEETNDCLEKKQFFTIDNVTESYLVHKNTKHIPAILRKSRSQNDNSQKEKNISGVEKYPQFKEMHNKSIGFDFLIDNNLESERTPDGGNAANNQATEAPKSKCVYMNAKYNQPSRINAEFVQNKQTYNNRISAHEKRLFKSPKHVDRNFVVMQPYEISPINSSLNIFDNNHDLFMSQPSQEYVEIDGTNYNRFQHSQRNSEHGNDMIKMPSFGDIQERTNRLTLRSSQNQNCSQGSSEQICSSQEDNRKMSHNFYKHQCELPNNYVAYTNQYCENLNQVPTPKMFNIPFKSNYNCNSQNSVDYKEVQSCTCKNDFDHSQKSNFPNRDSESRHQRSNCHARGMQNPVRHQKVLMNNMVVRPQNSQQPVKFIAIEENNMPQRRAVYNISEQDHVRNSQYAVMQVHSNNNATNQSCRQMSTVQCCSQDNQTAINPEFQCSNVCRVNNAHSSNGQRVINFDGVISGSNKRLINFVPNSVNNQIFIRQQNVPVHAVIEKNCLEQHVPTQQQLPLYSQVGHFCDYHSNNEVQNMNSVYLQHQNYVLQSKRT